jgi:diguanylate cyclase (GGDEF)-like protein
MIYLFPETRSALLKPDASHLALVLLLYFVGAKLGVMLTVMPEGLAIVWPPNAVVLAALIRFQGLRYPAIAALAVAAEFAADWPHFTVLESLLFGAVNVAEATVAYVLLRRWRFDARFSTPGDLVRFVLAGPVIGAFSAALLGGAIYSLFRGSETSYLAFVRIWWFGDAMGLLILTPLLLGFPPFGVRDAQPLQVKAVDVAVWIAAALAAALFWVSPDGRILGAHFGPILLLPFVLYCAARYPQRWAAAAVVTATMVIVIATTLGRPPFGILAPADAVVQAQEFIFIMSLMALGLTSLLTQLGQRTRELEFAGRTARELAEQLEARVDERTAELRRANEKLATLAAVDTLTGLYNRRGLLDIAQREFALSRRHGRSLALMVIDLDHFKAVNDRFGHLAGDEVLKHCADVLRGCMRASDTCGRYGGEEFVVVALETDMLGAVICAKRICEAFRKSPVASLAGAPVVTVSAGVTTLGREDQSVDAVLRRADEALYRAKSEGRDRVVHIAP